MLPRGMIESGPTPKNGREGVSLDMGICSFWKALRMMRLRAALPSIRTWYNLTLVMVGDDGNKSLYLVFVGVVFLSILDCF
jgi:hypothetical protein